jgi:hypothetical protein
MMIITMLSHVRLVGPLARGVALLLALATSVAASEPVAATLTLVRSNAAGTKLVPFKSSKPFVVDVALVDGVGTVLFSETLRVEPRSGPTPSDPAAGILRTIGPVKGSVRALVGAGAVALPDDLLADDLALVTTVSQLDKQGEVSKTFAPAPAVPLGWAGFSGGQRLDLASLSVGGDPVLDETGTWVGSVEGLQGPPGDPGAPGSQGLPGLQGEVGAMGEQGDVGPPGDPGADGDMGDTGDQGPQGDQGDDGPDERGRPSVAVDRGRELSRGLEIPLPGQANSLAFDGRHLWASSSFDNEYFKVRASDGALLASVDPPALANLGPVVWTGASLWVASFPGDAHELEPDTGVILKTATLPSGAKLLVYDGRFLWVANEFAETLSKVSAKSGAVLDTIALTGSPNALLFDGAALWVSYASSSDVDRFDPGSGALLGTSTMPDATATGAMVHVEGSVFVGGLNRVNRFDAGSGVYVQSYNLGSGTGSRGLASDGQRLWVTHSDSGGHRMSCYRISDGQLLDRVIGVDDGTFTDAVFDGNGVWCIARDDMSNWSLARF